MLLEKSAREIYISSWQFQMTQSDIDLHNFDAFIIL